MNFGTQLDRTKSNHIDGNFFGNIKIRLN